jgi:hypothetical protein
MIPHAYLLIHDNTMNLDTIQTLLEAFLIMLWTFGLGAMLFCLPEPAVEQEPDDLYDDEADSF